ncbi:hydantoinase/oxoprolinase N-terminal domain-containing protein, partial [Chloroflexota bacterium]
MSVQIHYPILAHMQTKKTKQSTIRIGIDIGGTFTDFVIFDPSTGKISTFKLPSTPHDPSEAVLSGIRSITNRVTTLSEYSKTNSEHQCTNSHTHAIQSLSIIHGSTVATNALLERKGAITALITTSGFKDVIQIGRQNRPDLYDFTTRPPDPLVPPELRFELNERIDQNGNIITAPKDEEIDRLISNLQSFNPQPQSIAVIFLFSFANPTHEQIITEKLRALGFFVSVSH